MKTLVLCIFSLGVVGCDLTTPSTDKDISREKTQLEIQSKLVDFQIQNTKNILAVQMQVAKYCADKGNTPVFINGNVDCKTNK